MPHLMKLFLQNGKVEIGYLSDQPKGEEIFIATEECRGVYSLERFAEQIREALEFDYVGVYLSLATGRVLIPVKGEKLLVEFLDWMTKPRQESEG